MSENKIIFIGDDHSIVNPRYYLINNMEVLYKLGVRHFCMEGFTLRNTKDSSYDFYCFFPWLEIGSKYEDVLLSEAILNINKNKIDSEKIKIYNPEELLNEREIENKTYY